MRRLLKGVLLFALVFALVGAPTLAWIVHSNGMAEVSVTVLRADASWELVDIEIGSISSGASFNERNNTTITIENAESLNVSFAIFTLTEEEKEALQSLTVTIGEDTDEDGEIDIPWGTIETDPVPLPGPSILLDEGEYNIVIVVEGVAGYPEAETPIGFVVTGTCSAIPITLP
jgi:hypothetical protein